MACGNRLWCDFCTCTKKGLSIERIHFNSVLWENDITSSVSDKVSHYLDKGQQWCLYSLWMGLKQEQAES